MIKLIKILIKRGLLNFFMLFWDKFLSVVNFKLIVIVLICFWWLYIGIKYCKDFFKEFFVVDIIVFFLKIVCLLFFWNGLLILVELGWVKWIFFKFIRII